MDCPCLLKSTFLNVSLKICLRPFIQNPKMNPLTSSRLRLYSKVCCCFDSVMVLTNHIFPCCEWWHPLELPLLHVRSVQHWHYDPDDKIGIAIFWNWHCDPDGTVSMPISWNKVLGEFYLTLFLLMVLYGLLTHVQGVAVIGTHICFASSGSASVDHSC